MTCGPNGRRVRLRECEGEEGDRDCMGDQRNLEKCEEELPLCPGEYPHLGVKDLLPSVNTKWNQKESAEFGLAKEGSNKRRVLLSEIFAN